MINFTVKYATHRLHQSQAFFYKNLLTFHPNKLSSQRNLYYLQTHKLLIMKNSVLLKEDRSCTGFWYLVCNSRSEMYPYPIAYEDGLISRLKSAADGRTAWGIVFKGYIISLRPAEKEMTVSEIENYCKANTFAGRPYCVVKGNVMIKFMRNIITINRIIKELGGVPYKSEWHIAKNNEYVGLNGVHKPTYYGVHPQISYTSENGFRGIWVIPTDMEITFYPAIKR